MPERQGKETEIRKGVVSEPQRHADNKYDDYDDDDINIDDLLTQRNTSSDDAIIAKLVSSKNRLNFQSADPQAFNNTFTQQRQQAISNTSYRSAIESWQPNTPQQLVDAIKTLSKGKSIIDRHWIIYYWIALNVEYDTAALFSNKHPDQSAENVFRTKKGVCAGYANIYKYLCDQLQMPCEVVGGYSKGYGFDDQVGVPTKTDHAWNAVEIDGHWYLMESTWGTGHLNDQKMFERKLDTYYFLPRPNEMIYHHLPEDNKWQLLQTSIDMQQYLQMPKLSPLYFDLNLELISPCNQPHADLLPDRSYALVLVRAPPDVHLITDLKLINKKIEGGHRVIHDKQKQIYCCYFAPANIGKHKITIFAKRGNTETSVYHAAIELFLHVNQLPKNSVSFPKTWENFFDLNIEVISPPNTHLIQLNNGVPSTLILIRTPENVKLLGGLNNENGQEIEGGYRIYYDRRNNIWRCSFARDRDGLFDAVIMAKQKSDSGNYTSAVSFKIEAKQIPSPNISYPYTWTDFYDLDLKIVAPQNRANAVWSDNASYAEVLIKAPNDVQLSCGIKYNGATINDASLAQFNNDKQLWQLLFAPQCVGPHELHVFGRRSSATQPADTIVVKFNLNVTKLRQPMKFPVIYNQFQTRKCQIYTPQNGILKKGSTVSIHCVIPNATDVSMTVDSQWLENEGYTDPILQRQITVGAKEVTIYAKYGQKSSYDGLVKYTVQ